MDSIFIPRPFGFELKISAKIERERINFSQLKQTTRNAAYSDLMSGTALSLFLAKIVVSKVIEASNYFLSHSVLFATNPPQRILCCICFKKVFFICYLYLSSWNAFVCATQILTCTIRRSHSEMLGEIFLRSISVSKNMKPSLLLDFLFGWRKVGSFQFAQCPYWCEMV